ncbi:microcystin degradation protein MlrC [Phenylobacterium hankyongense]|uniref:Microcystinase C n=1 Tax=Phenylobacterium hankyongense TaxID=1813876 RepID=A0A328B1S1_9CAUL|nr:M81 family metallopeptidase [Phenylobacterium hankyongense]RAK60757.1 microcystin degradation protein MlrC [Phenylobacterium hankyongense]
MTRVLLGGLFHETHTFVQDQTRLADFSIYRGADLLARRGDASPIDGFLTAADALGWDIVPAVAFDATPSGVVEHEAFEAFWQAFEAALVEALSDKLDGVFVSLHGAMVTSQLDDAEGELLARIRAVPGAQTLPVYGVIDFHTNLSDAMAQNADGLVCYRENPHIDAFERGRQGCELLARHLRTGRRPVTLVRRSPILLPPTGQGTADAPMRELELLARRLEAETPEVVAINVVAGFAFADVAFAGLAFTALVDGDTAAAERCLDALAELAWSLRHNGMPVEHELDQVLPTLAASEAGPILIVEPADNIGGGAPGDCTDVLRAFLRHELPNAAIAINDPDAVARLSSIAPGESLALEIGGKGSELDPGPVRLEVVLVSITDGRFQLEDRQSHLAVITGLNVDMGPTAVVRHRGLTLLLTSHKIAPFDLGQWRSQGLDPETFSFIGIKAAVGHRRAYDPIAAASYTVRTRGPCTSDLASLPYRKVRRPIFPLTSGDISQ